MEKDKSTTKALEIPVIFHNYKLLKDKEFVLSGSRIYFIQGPNRVGKTSFLKALTSLQIAQDDTQDKVTTGESEGFYEATIPASDGSIVTIRHEFTDNNKGKFIAIREDGTKISSVTEIRNLFNYTPINVNEFFAMSNTAEGRRKQRDIILKLMSDEERAHFNDLDLQESHYYTTRTEENKKVEQCDSSIKTIVISDEDRALVPRKDEAEKLLKSYENVKKTREEFPKLETVVTDLETRKTRLEREIEEKKEEIRSLETKIKDGKELCEEGKGILDPTKDISDEEIEEKITKGNNIITRINSLKTKEELIKDYTINRDEHQKESDSLTKRIEKCRAEKAKIVSDSELPVENISFEDGYLTIDGYVFKENQVCESDAVIILANILAKINPGPIQIIGDASVLDLQKLDILNSIAEKYNKIMFVDEVVRDANNMVVVGYEELSKKEFLSSIDTIAGTEKPKQTKKQKTENSVMPNEAKKEKDEKMDSNQDPNSEKPLLF
jgi:hypothetical protein